MYIQTEESSEDAKYPYKDRLDNDLYCAIRIERERRGIPNKSIDINIENHPLVGKKIKNNETGKIYNVEKAKKHWYCGWYIGLLIEQNGSHAFIWHENIDCWNDLVVNSIKKNATKYTLVEDK